MYQRQGHPHGGLKMPTHRRARCGHERFSIGDIVDVVHGEPAPLEEKGTQNPEVKGSKDVLGHVILRHEGDTGDGNGNVDKGALG